MMILKSFSAVVCAGAAVILLCPATVAAQRPTPQQAQQLLNTRPDLVDQLRARIIQSGMTADEVRARLRQEGYPDTLLDAYLPGSRLAAPDSVTRDVLAALYSLGVADSTAARAEADKRDRTESARAVPEGEQPMQVPRALAPSDEPDVKAGDEQRIFGLDVFRRQSSQFDPNTSGPVDANYRLGPGDRLALLLSGQVEAAYALDVTREGFVVVPQVGRIDVANLTLGQAQVLFYNQLRRVYSEITRGPEGRTHFTLSPVQLRSNQVYVVGEVLRPGSYRVSGAGTVLTALYAAGGPTATGTLRTVQVRRVGSPVATMDVYDYLLRGDAARDLRLENGDVVFVGVHGPRVQVAGQVVRPATYELKPGETLADVIAAAGGLRPTASRQRIQIQRVSPLALANQVGRERFVLDVASEQLLTGKVPALGMENGDMVIVLAITDRVRSSITVLGNLWTPGRIAFSAGLHLSQAIQKAGGVRPDVYLDQVVVSRLQSDSTRTQLYTAFRDTTGTVRDDIVLHEDDEVRVFSVSEFRLPRFVSVAGAVRQPGQYPYRERMSLRDLILQAGGLHERALLTELELARMPDGRRGGRLSVVQRVPLDSTYLLERGPGGRYLGPPGIPAPTTRAPEVVLQPYDNILVFEQPDWSMPLRVSVFGEVALPGVYTLLSKQEKLSDMLKRAGGLTDRAYAAGVVFVRQREQVGRIGIDLPRVIRDPRFRDNLQLEDGDSVFVPAYKATVIVSGAVNSPVAVAYVPGKDIDWYVGAAGGPTVRAASNRSWVVQPNGAVESRESHVWRPDAKPRPQPGSSVHVPEQDPTQKTDKVQMVGSVAQVLASLVTIVVILTR